MATRSTRAARRKLTTAGGEIRAGKLTELGLSWGKLTSLTLQSGDEIGAGQVVASATPAELAELLGKKAHQAARRAGRGRGPRRLPLHAQHRARRGRPARARAPRVAVIAATDRPPVGDAAFSIHLGETDDGGRVVATVAAILASDGPIEPDRLLAACAALRASLWQRLGDVMPFFERHLVLAHSPFEATVPHVPGGRGSYDVPRGLPLTPPAIWRGQLAQTADTGALPYSTGLKNLTLTGDQILPMPRRRRRPRRRLERRQGRVRDRWQEEGLSARRSRRRGVSRPTDQVARYARRGSVCGRSMQPAITKPQLASALSVA